jgi:hypothetical protein
MLETVVLFAGHRIDEPGRNPPRFPPECEPLAYLAIKSAVTNIATAQDGLVTGIAGAADGGDILFHEACDELRIASEICLALPVAEYVQTSVQPAWRERFYRLLQRHSVANLPQAIGDVWRRDHEWQIRLAHEKRPERTILLALSSEGEAEIEGGTSDMINMARAEGIEVIRLSMRKILDDSGSALAT